ncbi:MAG: response regulator transcription factor [Bifidobacterium crudilactis]|jgi:DNA-binding NarL/FixJ family response regulator
MRVAIVDDDPIVCSSLSTILMQGGGVEVIWTACDGANAVDSYRRMPPDVLLMDVQMSGGNGLDAARSIIGEDDGARILFLTTFADKSYIEQALSIGGKGYLIKQDVSSVLPALQAVMAGQVVLGAQALSQLPIEGVRPSASGHHEESGRLSALSCREREIAALVAQGLDNHDIAARLFLSEGTIRNRISDILAKLRMSNRTQLAISWIHAHRDEA